MYKLYLLIYRQNNVKNIISHVRNSRFSRGAFWDCSLSLNGRFM